MPSIDYLRFDQINPNDLLKTVNEDALRTHLVDHPYFDEETIAEWVQSKIEMNRQEGCRIRVVMIEGEIAGWCGIQPDDKGFEIAIVISQRFWGAGLTIFKTLMSWAKELGHEEVLFHLLESRREYKVLAKKAKKVSHSKMFDRNFTSYLFNV